MSQITDLPNISVKVERYGVYQAEDGLYVRIVYYRSDDERRMTSFYPCLKQSAEVLNALLKEREELLQRDKKLTALENAGVDNWEWYGDALESMQDES